MLKKGDYVRMLIAPNTRIGTIEGSKTEGGLVRYLFRQITVFLASKTRRISTYLKMKLCRLSDQPMLRSIS